MKKKGEKEVRQSFLFGIRRRKGKGFLIGKWREGVGRGGGGGAFSAPIRNQNEEKKKEKNEVPGRSRECIVKDAVPRPHREKKGRGVR